MLPFAPGYSSFSKAAPDRDKSNFTKHVELDIIIDNMEKKFAQMQLC